LAPSLPLAASYIEVLIDPQGFKGFDQAPMPALSMFLGVGKHAQDNQSRYDTSGYHILDHGCQSTGLADHVLYIFVRHIGPFSFAPDVANALVSHRVMRPFLNLAVVPGYAKDSTGTIVIT
jgi:hypothetical protein